MTYEQAMQRLAGYANLPGSDDGDPGLGPLLTRWQRTGDRLDVQAICQGIVECIQSMVSAEQVRGPVPLSTPLARPPAYSVSCILVDLSRAVASDRAQTDVASAQVLKRWLVIIAHCWSQYLAGDIEDLFQDLRDSMLWDE
jgi:hypothetical protein